MENFTSGALIDNRPQQEKDWDNKFGETVRTPSPVKWITKNKNEWRKFKKQDQDGSGSCVAQTIRKIAGVGYWLKKGVYIDFSATDIYQRRSNRPGQGMIGAEAFVLASEGITLNELVPSDLMSDDAMDSEDIDRQENEVGDVFSIGDKGNSGIELPVRDIEAIASVIQETGKAVMVWFYFGRNGEWWREKPVIVSPGLSFSSADKHSVAAVDFTLVDGEKCLIIEDSAGPETGVDGGHQRIITESFYKVRNWFARYAMNFRFEIGGDDRPKHTFTKYLYQTKDIQYDDDVVSFQDILKYEGLFPVNLKSSGWFGSITAKGWYDYCTKYGIASKEELDEMYDSGEATVGPKTIANLNKRYG
jgi:hypothetical protein